MRVLVLGSNGQLGRCISDKLTKSNYDVYYKSRNEFDVSELTNIERNILSINPNIIINASAYTAVDKAETEKELADLVNHKSVCEMAKVCKKNKIFLIHLSTDYVFDGKSKVPYSESDKTNPQGIYGFTKLNGELAIKKSGCQHIIIRTAWVFSEHGNNFLKTMLRLGADNSELSIVGDQFGSPTYAQDIASSIIYIINYVVSNKPISGIFHYCGNNSCSWFEFAQTIFKEAKLMGFRVPEKISSIATSDYPTPAKRPEYSSLDCSKIQNTFNIHPSDWKLGIKRTLNSLHNTNFSP